MTEKEQKHTSWLIRNIPLPPGVSTGEEIANSITHGIGALLSLAGLVLLVLRAALRGDAWAVVGFSVFAFAAMNLYTASTLYHALTGPRVKRVFRILDHTSIYILIAGTYTPVTLAAMRGPWGWTVFGVVWGIAISGILFEIFLMGKFKKLSLVLYILLGWIIVLAWKPMTRMVSPAFIRWLIAGGGAYTAGTVFYAWKRLPYGHAIWHLFVLGGTVLHFFGMYLNLT
ncbi:MAG: hemolysin III family protein [Spirochaetales bacterium]|nr:hemolysin III family protein [Spirochaetales bacterium]